MNFKSTSQPSINQNFKQKKRIAHSGQSNQKKNVSTSIDKHTDCGSAYDKNDIEILKKFDLTLEYGPSLGITRLERWDRADSYDLHPPIEVKNIVNRHPNDKVFTESLWHDYRILK